MGKAPALIKRCALKLAIRVQKQPLSLDNFRFGNLYLTMLLI